MGFKDWETPPEFFQALNEDFHFTLDAAASHENRLCKKYCTDIATFEVPFGETPQWEHRIGIQDGLKFSWEGERVFCNPPYDNTLKQWVEKAISSKNCIVAMLLPGNVDPTWYHLLFPEHEPYTETLKYERWGYTWTGVGGDGWGVAFLHGRMKFYRNGKVGPTPRQGTILYIRNNTDKAIVKSLQ